MMPGRFPPALRPALAALAALVALAFAAIALALPQHVDNPHGRFKEDCQTCHVASSWKEVRVGKKFDHAKFGFPLSGAHAAADCMSCHTTLDFSQSKTACASCHQDPHRGELGTDCARCHGARSFIDRAPMVRQHQLTSFPLTGVHAALDCESCHRPAAQGQMQFVGTQAACVSCHLGQYQSAKSPDHVAGGFPTDCQACHGTISWSTASFDHNTTRFPLTGAHASVACARCHGDGVYAGKSTDCYSCHQSNYSGASNPPHTPASFPTSTPGCTGCHNTTAWQPSTFNHNNTPFPLTGAHPAVACTGCHNASTWAVPGNDCSSCHMADYNGTTNPKHDPGGFPIQGCACHNTSTWAGATNFDHAGAGFPLTGLHATPPRQCTDCHASGYVATSPACISCHQNSSPGYATGPPAHDATNFPPANCTTCHAAAAQSYTSWAGGTFPNHTWFPITTGNHNVPCMSCHTSNSNLTLYSCSVACHTQGLQGHDPVTNSCGTFSLSTVPTMCYCCHRTGRAG